MVKDAARAETPFSQVSGARYGYLAKYNLPLSKSVVAPVAPKASPPSATVQPQRASKPDDVVPAQSRTSSPPKSESRWRAPGPPQNSRGHVQGMSRRSCKLGEPRRRSGAALAPTGSCQADRVLDTKTSKGRPRAYTAEVAANGMSQDPRKNCLWARVLMRRGRRVIRVKIGVTSVFRCVERPDVMGGPRKVGKENETSFLNDQFGRPGTRTSHGVGALFMRLPSS